MASIRNGLAAAVKHTLGKLDLEITKTSRNPRHTLLGLRHLPIRSVIDVGANKGQFAAEISRFFPTADLYCFEPLAECCAELRRWAASKDGACARVFNVALGAEEGEAMMRRHTAHNASSSLLATTEVCESLYPQTRAQDAVPVKLTTLDAALRDQTLQREILIKLDTQGYERQVIQGGMVTFRQAAACIIEVNLYRLYEQQPSFIELAAMLDELGYRYAGNLEQTYSPQGEVVYIDAVFVRETQ